MKEEYKVKDRVVTLSYIEDDNQTTIVVHGADDVWKMVMDRVRVICAENGIILKNNNDPVS